MQAEHPRSRRGPTFVLHGGDEWAHRRAEPRPFAAMWIMYLSLATMIALGGVGIAGIVHNEVFRLAAKLLLTFAAASIGVLWPLIRLSQERPEKPARAIFADLWVVVIGVQPLIWPQCLPWMGGWPVNTVAAVSVALGAWAVLVGGVLAILLNGETRGRWPISRAGAMAIVFLITLGAPALTVLRPLASPGAIDVPDLLLTLSPFTVVYELLRDRSWSGQSALVYPYHWAALALVGCAGIAAWVLAFASRPGTPAEVVSDPTPENRVG